MFDSLALIRPTDIVPRIYVFTRIGAALPIDSRPIMRCDQPDDSHTNFGWDDAVGGFTTHALKGDVRLGLKFVDLALVVVGHEGNGPEAAFRLGGNADLDARRWLQEQVAERGVDTLGLDSPGAL